MKISSRVDGPVRGAVLATRPASVALRAVPSSGRRSFSRRPTSPPRAFLWPDGSCRKSSVWLRSTFVPDPEAAGTPPPPRLGQQGRQYSMSVAVASASKLDVPQQAALDVHEKRRLLSLVESYGEGSAEELFQFHRDPYRRGYAMPDGPNLRVSDKKQDTEYPSGDDTARITDSVQQLLVRLCAAIGQRLRHPNRVALETIYKLYAELPEPRMLHLTGQWRNRLLRVMGMPRKRDMESMLRYFALVADVKNAGLTLRRSQWNYALAFAAKYTARTTVQEMESALRLWREMEREAQVRGNDVTFNVLFDVAAKAGNFTLADMIYREMESRGIEFNRFHHVSLIHYFGLKLDSEGVRAAYREMVEAGEMIDTVVLNCVISGLLRCGEEGAAEETYERMKSGHARAADMPSRDYMMNKVITKVLIMFAKVSKQHPGLKDGLQASVSLAPDLHTYKLLVQHYAIRVGNLAKVAQYLDEMKHLRVPMHPTIFLALFKGFYMHGGFAGPDWSEQRLHGVLSALYQARDQGLANGFRIDRWVVIWALRAVKRCSSTEALVQTFDAMAQRWDIDEDRLPFMHAIFDNILQGKDLKSSWSKSGEMSQRQEKRGRGRL